MVDSEALLWLIGLSSILVMLIWIILRFFLRCNGITPNLKVLFYYLFASSIVFGIILMSSNIVNYSRPIKYMGDPLFKQKTIYLDIPTLEQIKRDSITRKKDKEIKRKKKIEERAKRSREEYDNFLKGE